MVETSIAIIASSLPSIKTLIYAARSTNASSGQHYELSSHRARTQTNTQITGGSSRLGNRRKSHQLSNDSDEDLFSKEEPSSRLDNISERSGPVMDTKSGIIVSSTYTIGNETEIPPAVEESRLRF